LLVLLKAQDLRDMAYTQEQIDELKVCYPHLFEIDEGGEKFILIKNLKLPLGCNPQVVDGLLCPHKRDGYLHRLFLSSKITHKGKGQNWNVNGALIADQQWWAVSWKVNKENVSLVGMVVVHLEAFR